MIQRCSISHEYIFVDSKTPLELHETCVLRRFRYEAPVAGIEMPR